ncbi:MAG: hypothetical protein GEV08_07090 [Acidimicrobiia bacterium]|nr:hypothetical protein [Acidimicrobiia bacterium]
MTKRTKAAASGLALVAVLVGLLLASGGARAFGGRSSAGVEHLEGELEGEEEGAVGDTGPTGAGAGAGGTAGTGDENGSGTPDEGATEPATWSGGDGVGDGWSAGEETGGWWAGGSGGAGEGEAGEEGGWSGGSGGGDGGTGDGGDAEPAAAELSAPTALDLGSATTGAISVANTGGQALHWEAVSSVGWLAIDPAAGPQAALAPGAVLELGVIVEHSAFAAGEAFAAEVHLASDGDQVVVSVSGAAPPEVVQFAQAELGQVCVSVVPVAQPHPHLVTLLVSADVAHAVATTISAPGYGTKPMDLSGGSATTTLTGAQGQLLAAEATIDAQGIALDVDSAKVALTPGCHHTGPAITLSA